ncbi:serine/arginine repetitive matrix protein 2-like [Stylophora pistillata]|uniref:SFR19-like C-terminal domain-containing protein n=1 Tax=Stylophora pistillata TaxID=50429 RepID=A0A2B4S5C2_STYPI|nr:serine/arginine repetitive matrix protein 2-like [Stylophora pistillata]XP_022793827.1 serine/arginine repetitive matrix protein 2-like [Stylophora pistillata]XP_022793828.1 serine/arginine repetitive matrix protein 2-like [Stylophora pistillata]PFX23675.1 hypothetical protein AWC38_SpisGene11767 [Stylophora pistillata]
MIEECSVTSPTSRNMQEEFPKKNQSSCSLYTEEELEGVSTSSSLKKRNSARSTEIDFSEVSSTSENTYQGLSTSSKGICMDLYEEDIPKSNSNVPVVFNDGNTDEKPKKLSLVEYVDSGNNTEEDMVNSSGLTQDKSIKTRVDKSNQDTSKFQCSSIAEVITSNETPSKNETCSSGVAFDVLLSDDKTSPKEGDLDVKSLLNDSRTKRDTAKEDGQLSASDSSDTEKSSDSNKADSKKSKKDRGKKKDKKKKKKKHKKQKQGVEREAAPGNRDGDEKKEGNESTTQSKGRGKSRSHSRSKPESQTKSSEKSEKPLAVKQSRSRSRERFARHHGRSRSRSRENDRKLKHRRERSKRSRSCSSSKRRSPARINRLSKYQSSRSRSRNRSKTPSMKRRERNRSNSRTRSYKRDYPSSRKRKLSRSPSPRKHKDNRKSRSTERHSHSSERKGAPPVKNRRSHNDKNSLSPRRSKSPNRKDHKSRSSPSRKLSHRTSSASDSLDSGHFTNIPLTQLNKQDDPVAGIKETEKKMLGVELAKESSVPPKSEADVQKHLSPSDSPLKAWEDEFDFVFTERLSPKDGTEKTVEDVLFGKEIADFKTPDTLKSKATKESVKSNSSRVSIAKEAKEEAHNEEKKELEEKKRQQFKEHNSKSKQGNSKVEDAENTPNVVKLDDSIGEVKVAKSNCVKTCNTKGVKRTSDDSSVNQGAEEPGKSAFMPSKFESIPFLGDTPPGPIPEIREPQHPIIPAPSQLGLLGPHPGGRGLLPTPPFPAHPWAGPNSIVHGVGLNIPKGSQGLLPTPGTLANLPSKDGDMDKTRKNLSSSPMDMEMSSPEGDIIDKLNEEFWRQQQQQNQDNAKVTDLEGKGQMSVDSTVNDQYLFDEPYEPETGILICEEFEEDLDSITDPIERKKQEKKQQKEKTKVQEVIDRLHRQARVEEEVKHVLKAYYKHKDISKEQYKSVLRRAVPQITNSSSAIDPERIRSFVKKCIAKMKKKRLDS